MVYVVIKQFNADNRCIDWIRVVCNEYELHIATYDVLIKDCVRVEYQFY